MSQTLQDVDNDCMVLICEYLEGRELLSVAQTCCAWRELIINTESLTLRVNDNLLQSFTYFIDIRASSTNTNYIYDVIDANQPIRVQYRQLGQIFYNLKRLYQRFEHHTWYRDSIRYSMQHLTTLSTILYTILITFLLPFYMDGAWNFSSKLLLLLFLIPLIVTLILHYYQIRVVYLLLCFRDAVTAGNMFSPLRTRWASQNKRNPYYMSFHLRNLFAFSIVTPMSVLTMIHFGVLVQTWTSVSLYVAYTPALMFCFIFTLVHDRIHKFVNYSNMEPTGLVSRFNNFATFACISTYIEILWIISRIGAKDICSWWIALLPMALTLLIGANLVFKTGKENHMNKEHATVLTLFLYSLLFTVIMIALRLDSYISCSYQSIFLCQWCVNAWVLYNMVHYMLVGDPHVVLRQSY
jgi:hypothetical protein